MRQAKFSLDDAQAEFIAQYRALGYADKSALVRAAIEGFMREHEAARLRESADLYAQVYADDEDLQHLTDRASDEWPE
jgi:hypothetical protein